MAGIIQIRGVPDPLYRRLTARAGSNNRTVAEEVLAILEDVLIEPAARTPHEQIDQARQKKNEARRRAMIDWALR